jgi:hypothetical protein
MSAYTKTTNFTAKDSLTSGNPSKVVKGSEIDAEFTAIQTAVNSKSDTASPTFTGTVTIPTAAITNFTFGGTPVTSTAAELNVLDGITATVTELNFTDGVTGAIQTQLDAKAPLVSPVLVTPNLGTPSAGTLTNATGLPIVAGTTGTLSQARGGTGVTTASNGQLLIGNGTGFTAATLTAGSGVTLTNGAGSIQVAFSGPGAGSVTSVGGTGTVNGITLTGTVTASGDLTLGGTLSGVDLTSQITGTLPVANGGTGITSFGTGVATALGQNVSGTGGIVLGTAPSGDLVGTTATQTLTGKTIRDTVYALSGTAFDATNGAIQTKTLAAIVTFTDSLTSGDAIVLMLEGGATYAVTWPTTTWVTSGGNAAPTLTAKDTLVFWKISTTLYGAYTGSYV